MKNRKRIRIGSVLTVFCLLLTAFTAFVFADEGTKSIYASYKIPTGTVRMTAHRGYSAVAPENTLPAFRMAGENGFWGAECDTSPTADGVWIIMHDETVDRMTNGTGKVNELTFDEIRALTVDAGKNAEKYPAMKVPTLTEYLDVCKRFGLHPVIEIKTNARAEDMDSLAALLGAREEKDMFTIITFGRELAARIKTLMPATPVYLLIGGVTQEVFLDGIRFCRENRLDGIDFACVWEQDMVEQVREAGLKTMVWTVDDVKTAEKYYDMGVRDFTTDSLTPKKPNGTLWQRFRWRLRDFVYAVKTVFQRFFKIEEV